MTRLASACTLVAILANLASMLYVQTELSDFLPGSWRLAIIAGLIALTLGQLSKLRPRSTEECRTSRVKPVVAEFRS